MKRPAAAAATATEPPRLRFRIRGKCSPSVWHRLSADSEAALDGRTRPLPVRPFRRVRRKQPQPPQCLALVLSGAPESDPLADALGPAIEDARARAAQAAQVQRFGARRLAEAPADWQVVARSARKPKAQTLRSPRRVQAPARVSAAARAVVVMPQEADGKVVTMIYEAMSNRLPQLLLERDFLGLEQPEDLEDLAQEVTLEFQQQLQNPRPQLRALIWNLRDEKNTDFVLDVITKVIMPQQLPLLATEEMASKAARSERAALQAQGAREVTFQRGPSGLIDSSQRTVWKALNTRKGDD